MCGQMGKPRREGVKRAESHLTPWQTEAWPCKSTDTESKRSQHHVQGKSCFVGAAPKRGRTSEDEVPDCRPPCSGLSGHTYPLLHPPVAESSILRSYIEGHLRSLALSAPSQPLGPWLFIWYFFSLCPHHLFKLYTHFKVIFPYLMPGRHRL